MFRPEMAEASATGDPRFMGDRLTPAQLGEVPVEHVAEYLGAVESIGVIRVVNNRD